MQVLKQGNRGTGKTLSMVKQLPADGCFVFVHNSSMKTYIEQMIADIHGRDYLRKITILVADRRANDRIRGTDKPIHLDHAVFDFAPRDVISELYYYQQLHEARNGKD